MNQIAMALQAIVLENPAVAFRDQDRLMKVLQCEALGMAIAVISFGDPFGQALMRQVTAHTRREAVVAGLLPGVELRLHDMAVGASCRIRAEVGEPLGVVEGEHTQAGQRSGKKRNDG